MPSNGYKMVLVATLLAGLACALPGTVSPTPFVFPTPNLTLTAIFQPTETETVPQTSETARTTTEPTMESTIESSPDASESTATPTGEDRLNRPTVTAPLLGSPPSIDADLSDWPDQRWSATEVVYGRSQWSSGTDLSASFAVAWDAQNLYLAATVNDETHVQQASGYELYKGDSVEILLDSLLEVDLELQSLSADDYQIGLSPGDFNSREPQAYRWFPRSIRAPLSSPTISAVARTDGYVVEASLPWVTVGVDPKEGDLYGFAFSVSDNDLIGTRLQQSMVSSVATRILTDPTSWGTLRLAGPTN